jgi:hypothetical protein
VARGGTRDRKGGIISRTESISSWLRNPSNRWLCVVLGLAAAVRLVGIGHDLPHVYYPDEQHVVHRTVALGSGDLNPHWFHKPAGLLYLLFFEFGVAFGAGRVIGAFASVDDFALRYFLDPSLFLWIGRLTVCAFGLATVVLVYRFGARWYSREVGLVAALLLAFTGAHVISSQEVKEDVPCAFLTLASTLLLVRASESGRARDLVSAGLLGGLAVATKYYAFYLFPAAIAAAFIGRFVSAKPAPGERALVGDLRAFAGILGFAAAFQAAFFAASPFNFLDPQWYSIDFRPPIKQLAARLSIPWIVYPLDVYFRGAVSLRRIGSVVVLLAGSAVLFVTLGRLYRRRAGRVAFLAGVPLVFAAATLYLAARSDRFRESIEWWQRVLFAPAGMGPAIAALALLGLLAAALRRTAADLVMLVCAGAYFLLASLYNQPQRIEPRHLAVLYPILALAGAALVVSAAGRLRRRAAPRAGRVFVAIAVAGACLHPAVFLAGHTQRNLRKDTRTLAKEWFERNVPAGTKVLNDKEQVKIRPGRQTFERLLERFRREADPSEPFMVHRDRLYAYHVRAADHYPGPTYDVIVLDPPWWLTKEEDAGTAYDPGMGNTLAVRHPERLDAYREQGVAYVITTSKTYRQYTQGAWRPNWPRLARFYDELETAELVLEIPEEPGRNGPEVRVYRL